MLFGDELAPPLGGPVVEVCAVAKRDLKAGEMLDDYGMYMTYGEAVNVDEMSARPLPARRARGGLQADARRSPRTRSSPTTTSSSRPAASPTAARRAVPALPGETWLEERLKPTHGPGQRFASEVAG